MPEPSSLPSGGRTREEIAKIEIGQTNVDPSTARALVAFFLACIVTVPIIEIVVPKWVSSETAATVWSRLREIPGQMVTAVASEAARGRSSVWSRAVAANRAAISGLVAFENGLEDESVLGRILRPPAQHLLSGRLGAGNERVYLGREDESGVRWLFYRPDVEYVTTRGFLEDDVIRRRIATASEWRELPQPDPRRAILEFHRQLAEQGIKLIVVPTPVRPVVHPEMLVSSYAGGTTALQNPSYAFFVQSLQSQGIAIFDPADVLTSERQSGAQFLATDTHWRPESMELVAERLASFVEEQVVLPQVSGFDYRIDEREVINAGDTVVMLDLPSGQQLYPRERALIRRVVAPDGSAWRPDRNGDVLVLGDSFSNIYSLASMGWGDSAGLVESLSYVMRRPIDRIVQNDDGAFATRAMLRQAGPERLARKRVVIWQFAVRELASGDWKVFP
jgi:hypothetical protein